MYMGNRCTSLSIVKKKNHPVKSSTTSRMSMAMTTPSHRGTLSFSSLLRNGLSKRKRKMEIMSGNVTEPAIFSTAPTMMTAIMSKADLPASLGFFVFSNMSLLYASLDNTAISDMKCLYGNELQSRSNTDSVGRTAGWCEYRFSVPCYEDHGDRGSRHHRRSNVR